MRARAVLRVHFEAAPTFHASAWIGIVPAAVEHGSEEINDRHDTTYEYLRQRTSGTVTLTAPAQLGHFDVRLHDTDRQGREVASAPFQVVAVHGELQLPATDFIAGQAITVHYRVHGELGSSAWAGIVPSNVPHGSEEVNDQHDLGYRHIQGAEGDLELSAPSTPGTYDVRLHDSDSNGNEIAFATFTVEVATARLFLERTHFAPGASITVRFEVPDDLAGDAWAGLVPSAVPHGSEETNDQHDLAYRYLRGATSGTLEFSAPDTRGSFDIRLHDTDNSGNEIASASLVVE